MIAIPLLIGFCVGVIQAFICFGLLFNHKIESATIGIWMSVAFSCIILFSFTGASFIRKIIFSQSVVFFLGSVAIIWCVFGAFAPVAPALLQLAMACIFSIRKYTKANATNEKSVGKL